MSPPTTDSSVIQPRWLSTLPVRLALCSLVYDWRRFSPAVVAVGFSGLLVLLQGAIILGIFSLSSLYVTRSTADLWVGYPGVQSLDLGRPISGTTELFLRMNPAVTRVEPVIWGSGEWRTAKHGMVNVYIVGVATRAGSMALQSILTPEQRDQLLTPGAVLVDVADAHKLGALVGDTAEINGHAVRIVGMTRGLRGLGGVNVITSLANAQRVDPTLRPGASVAYFLARLAHPEQAGSIVNTLNQLGAKRGFEAQTTMEFANRTTHYWLAESGAGVAFVFGSVVSVLIAIVITSQTLLAAVSGSIKEYAALRALGFSMPALRAIVLAQSFWVGAVGVVVASICTLLLAVIARAAAVPLALSGGMFGLCAAIVLMVAIVSGLVALRRVAQADPAVLLL